MSTPRLSSRRFFFVTGKGGVGKTTITAALALHLARSQRVLVTMSGPKERFSKLLDAPPLTTEIQELRTNLYGVQLVPEVALREYGMLVLKSRRLVETIFDNRYVQGFFNGAPGLKEWSLLGKAWYHSTELESNGRPRFDTVLFDAPATGHGLDMLRVPKVIVDIAPPGALRRDAERAWQMFRDPALSGVLLVTLPEEMPANETYELSDALKTELGLPVAMLVVNSVLPELFSPAERQVLARLPDTLGAAPGDAAILSGKRRALRETLQRNTITRLAGLGHPILELPELELRADSLAATRVLAEYF